MSAMTEQLDNDTHIDHDGEHGFTLLELLVALSILGISLTTLMAVFGEGLDRASDAERRMEARLLAQSLIAGAGIETPLEIGTASGDSDTGIHWERIIEPFGNRRDHESWDFGAVQLTATVSWLRGEDEASLTLTSLRLAPKELMQ